MTDSSLAHFDSFEDRAAAAPKARPFPINIGADDLARLIRGKDSASRGVSSNRAMSILKRAAEPYGLYVGSNKRRASRDRRRQNLLTLHIAFNIALVVGAAWAWWSHPRTVVIDRLLVKEPCQVLEVLAKASTLVRETSHFVSVKCRSGVHHVLHPVRPDQQQAMHCDFVHRDRATDDPPVFCRQD